MCVTKLLLNGSTDFDEILCVFKWIREWFRFTISVKILISFFLINYRQFLDIKAKVIDLEFLNLKHK